MIKQVIAFADGENLSIRYKEMLKMGNLPKDDIINGPDCFVWSPRLTTWTYQDVIRFSYYTSIIGDDKRVAEVSDIIARTRYTCRDKDYYGEAKLIPRVHKKQSTSQKTKIVDVELTMDVMRAVLQMPIDAVYILSGDGDYLDLVKEIEKTTNKQVYIGAFS